MLVRLIYIVSVHYYCLYNIPLTLHWSILLLMGVVMFLVGASTNSDAISILVLSCGYLHMPNPNKNALDQRLGHILLWSSKIPSCAT